MQPNYGPLDDAAHNAHRFSSGLLLCSAIDDTLKTAKELLGAIDDDLDSPEDIEEYKETIEHMLTLMLEHPVETGV